MNLDTFNYGSGVSLTTADDYNPHQYNAQGQSLAQTPPINGAPISVDPTNDHRDAMDIKRQALEAQRDVSSIVDKTNKIEGKDGYLFDKVDDSRSAQMKASADAFAQGYWGSNGDHSAASAAGGLAAANAVHNIHEMKKRESLIPSLVASGKYNQMDIDKWRSTGILSDLTANAGKWTSDGNGFEHNTLTGESRRIEGYAETPKLTQVNLGDRVAFVDASGNEVSSIAAGVKPGSTGSGSTGSGIGLDDEADKVDSQHMQITDPDGTTWHVAVNSRGTPIVDAKTGMATVYNDQGQTSSRVYNPTYTQQSGQVATEGLNSIKDLRSSGLLHNTGNSLTDKAKRAYADATGGNYTADLQSHFDNINDQIHTFSVNKLIQEGVRPTEELVKAEMSRYGHLDINNSRDRNLAILDKLEGAFNSGYHQAASHATHTEMKDTNYASPGAVNPTGSAAATKSKSGSDFSNLW